MENNNSQSEEILVCSICTENSGPDIRIRTSNIRKNLCAKCSMPLPVTIRKEIVCPNCGAINPAN